MTLHPQGNASNGAQDKNMGELVRVFWTDAHNTTGAWHTKEEAVEFAADNNWQCSNVGWVVEETDDYVLIAARSTNSQDQFGLLERIPKRMVEKIIRLGETK